MPPVIPPTTSPLGFFVPSPGHLALPGPLLADKIDPHTNEYLSIFTGDDVIDAQVLIAMKTARGSGAAVLECGSRLRSIRKLGDSVVSDIEAEVRNALALLVQQGDIIIKSIVVTVLQASQQAEIELKYVNQRARDRSVRTQRVTPAQFGSGF